MNEITDEFGIEQMIRSGAEIQHNGNLLGFVAKDYVRQPGPNYLDTFDLSEADKKLPELVALMAENDVALTPTMIVDVTALASQPDGFIRLWWIMGSQLLFYKHRVYVTLKPDRGSRELPMPAVLLEALNLNARAQAGDTGPSELLQDTGGD